MNELINAHIFEPYYKNVKARCELLYCDNHENWRYYWNNLNEIEITITILCTKA